ncbi:hypothetical protein [Amycolatopsis sp. WGS_07]|uniref:hypothetical protein n=1 Tax=Amycolatopsis sp. WGS_07 TaxID=3076764 RepID=UPI0038730617
MTGPKHYIEAEKLLVKPKRTRLRAKQRARTCACDNPMCTPRWGSPAPAGVSGYEAMQTPDSSDWRKVAGAEA